MAYHPHRFEGRCIGGPLDGQYSAAYGPVLVAAELLPLPWFVSPRDIPIEPVDTKQVYYRHHTINIAGVKKGLWVLEGVSLVRAVEHFMQGYIKGVRDHTTD